jgi:hypothetical protein
MPIGDGCGWGSSTKNSDTVGMLKGLSNAVTGPLTTAGGLLVSPIAKLFQSSNAGKMGYDTAKSLQIDSDGICYDTCNNNESMSWDGEMCIDDRTGLQRARVPTNIKNIRKHNVIDYIWDRDLRNPNGNPEYQDNITVVKADAAPVAAPVEAPAPAAAPVEAPAAAPAPAAPVVAPVEAPAAASTGRRRSRKMCRRGKLRDRASKRCRRKKCSRGKVRDLKSKRCRNKRRSE